MKKMLVVIFVFVMLISFCFGQEKRFQLSLLGGLNHVFEYGSEADYVLEENDFPVTPAHNPPIIGISFAYFFSKNVGIELDGRYNFTSEVTLEDPSDQDKINLNTSLHASLTVNFIYQFLSDPFRPYFILGGGLDQLLDKDEVYTTESGYIVEFLVPEETINSVHHVGCGANYLLSSNFGIRLDVRYVFLVDEPSNVKSVNIMFGILHKF